MEEKKPYYCPDCRSNRVKFSVITSYSQKFLKNAVTGAIEEYYNPEQVEAPELKIQCSVCGFVGNEMRFIKQAERQPRTQTITNSFV